MSIEKLLDISSHALSDLLPTTRASFPEGALGDQLWSLLVRKNGFYAFESALHVYPAPDYLGKGQPFNDE